MHVQFRTTAAGPNGVYSLGKVYELEEEAARPFLSGGYAHEVEFRQGKWHRIGAAVAAGEASPKAAKKAASQS